MLGGRVSIRQMGNQKLVVTEFQVHEKLHRPFVVLVHCWVEIFPV